MNQGVVSEAEIEDRGLDFGRNASGDFASLTLTGQEPATNIQNEILGDEIGQEVRDSPVVAVGDRDDVISEPSRLEEGGGGDPPVDVLEAGIQPRAVQQSDFDAG